MTAHRTLERSRSVRSDVGSNPSYLCSFTSFACDDCLARLTFYHLSVEENNAQDISTYLSAKTKRLISAAEASIYTDFVQSIVDRMDGVPLWVFIITEEFLNGWESSDIIAQLCCCSPRSSRNLTNFSVVCSNRYPRLKFMILKLCLDCCIYGVMTGEIYDILKHKFKLELMTMWFV